METDNKVDKICNDWLCFSAIHPPLDSYIFLRVKESTEGVMMEEETTESR